MQERTLGCLVVDVAAAWSGILTERDLVLKLAGKPLDGVRVRT